MDNEKAEVVGQSEAPKQDETVMAVDEKLLTPEPENPAAAVEETEQLAANGHATAEASIKEPQGPVVTQENEEVAVEDCQETPDKEPAVAPPELAESSEITSDPVVALDDEPESFEPEPVPENNPEPLQTPLAEGSPEPKPEKPTEAVPEAQVQEKTSPAPTGEEQAVEKRPPAEEQEKIEGPAAAESVVVTEASAEKQTEVAKVEETPLEMESVGPSQSEKEANLESESVSPKAEPAVETEAKSEAQKEGEAPAPGSFSFALLEQKETKDGLQLSRVLVVLRGLPGCGKTLLASAIADAYKDQCSVLCADVYGIKPESPSPDGYKALDDALLACCSEGTASQKLVVVDDTNHTHDRLARLGEIAGEQNMVAIFLEPQTEWRRDVAQLKQKNKRGLEEACLEAMKGPLEETSFPLYFGWFLLSSVQEKFRCTAMDFLKTLDTLKTFKKHLVDFTGEAEKEVDLEQYFKPKGVLHCTTKFCNYGKADGAKEYAQNPAVQKSYSSVSELSLTAVFVTPRTFGARVSLSDEQLLLWPADAEKEGEHFAAASLPLGSRAHVTLGCAEGVEPVQTGFDLLQILTVPEGDESEEMELGTLRYYGEGRWMLCFREPIGVLACFSSLYECKEVEPTKKEPEKKRKSKCVIL